jgi:hypothetical protein
MASPANTLDELAQRYPVGTKVTRSGQLSPPALKYAVLGYTIGSSGPCLVIDQDVTVERGVTLGGKVVIHPCHINEDTSVTPAHEVQLTRSTRVVIDNPTAKASKLRVQFIDDDSEQKIVRWVTRDGLHQLAVAVNEARHDPRLNPYA